MTLARAMLALLAATSATEVRGTFDPYVAGPHAVGHSVVEPLLHPDLPVTLSVTAPMEEGTFPLVVFITSFQDIVPAAAQSVFLERLASHGLVVATAWSLTETPGPEPRALELEQVMDWIHAHLQGYIHRHHLPGVDMDFNKTILLSHSSGAHILVSYLERQCEADQDVKGLALISPVDGVDPFGIIKDYCITPGQKVNFTVPTVVLTAGLDPIQGFPLFPACAPAELSNDRFYDAMSAPRWQLNATGYGHADFWDDALWQLVQEIRFCAVCSADDCAVRDTYRNYVAGQVVSFVAAVTDPAEHCDQLGYLEDTSLHPVSTNGRHERDDDVCDGFMTGCVRP